jgi:hypothetical protein
MATPPSRAALARAISPAMSMMCLSQSMRDLAAAQVIVQGLCVQGTYFSLCLYGLWPRDQNRWPSILATLRLNVNKLMPESLMVAHKKCASPVRGVPPGLSVFRYNNTQNPYASIDNPSKSC